MEKCSLEKALKMGYSYKAKDVASVAACLLGAASMYIMNGETGIGWAVFGLALIWN